MGDRDFDLLVTIFVGSDIADQAYVFATVNLEQTKVNKSLAIDLYELARSRSPVKTCHNVVVALDQTKTSPFYRRIKRLGVTSSDPTRSHETITQATFVNALVVYVSDEPKIDRDQILRGRKLPLVSGREERRLPFRNMFIREEDIMIGKIVEQYFKAVQERWPDAWDAPRGAGIILNQTNGFRALMRMFGKVYNELAKPGQFVESEQFARLFARVDVPSTYFSVDNFVPGTSGEGALRAFFDERIFGNPKLPFA
jgi:DGQHR domain-containing protein